MVLAPEERPEANHSNLKNVESQLRLMTKVFMDSADPIIIRDLRGYVLEINNEFQRVFGFSREEIMGQRIKHLLLPEYHQLADQVHERRLRGEAIRNFEAILRAKSGRLVPIIATGFILTDENEVPVGMAEILKDVTLIKKAHDKVKQRNRDLQQFARALSHDLAAPLESMRGLTELLLIDHAEQLDEEGRTYFQAIVGAVNRMGQMIKDLLGLAQIDNDLDEFQPVDVSIALEQALSNLHATIQEKDAKVTSESLPTIEGSESLLARLLQNLIGNAIKFCQNDPPKVHVSAKQCEDTWQFSIRDNGIGIDPKDQEKIFAPLQRLHAERVFPGTGIGLATCRSIVERHGGRIWVESEKGCGSVFHFTIPDQPSDLE